jgi:cell filamentation protein
MVMSENVPAALQRLPVAKVPGAIAELYSAIDYAHPFADGNSRTLRVFTRQLALQPQLGALGGDSIAHARLYVARDLAGHARALPHIRGHANLRDVQYALDVLAQNVTLEKLLKQAIS